jgi:hypothetical protein
MDEHPTHLKARFKTPKDRVNGALIGLLAVAIVSGLRAGEIPSLDKRHWSLSADVQTGYDDNVYTAAQDEKASLFTGSNAAAGYSDSTGSTSFSLRLGGGAQHYFDLPDRTMDYSGFGDFGLTQILSSRWTMNFSDHVLYAPQSPLSETNNSSRRLGDSVDNSFGAGSQYEIARHWFVDLSGTHEILAYNDNSTNNDLGRQTFGVNPALRYRCTEETTFKAMYRYSRVDYNASPRDADTHTATLGWNQVFSPHWSGGADAGGEWRQEDNSSSNDTMPSPYVSAQLTCRIGPMARISGGMQYSQQETDLSAYLVSRTAMGFIRASCDLNRHLRWDTDLNVVNSDLESSGAGGNGTLNEKTYAISQKLTWTLSKNISLNLTYSHTTQNSDDSIREFDRNKTAVGVSIFF